jgi:hypothetical protein
MRIKNDRQALKMALKIIKAEERRAFAYQTGTQLPEWVFTALDRKQELEEYVKDEVAE